MCSRAASIEALFFPPLYGNLRLNHVEKKKSPIISNKHRGKKAVPDKILPWLLEGRERRREGREEREEREERWTGSGLPAR